MYYVLSSCGFFHSFVIGGKSEACLIILQLRSKYAERCKLIIGLLPVGIVPPNYIARWARLGQLFSLPIYQIKIESRTTTRTRQFEQPEFVQRYKYFFFHGRTSHQFRKRS